jgi:hypothetical protein
MGSLLVAALGPTIAFGVFALLALRFGAESRPWFDERPVRDDRPNWFAIPRSAAPPVDERRPTGGTPIAQERPAASPSRAAISPSGVWSAASTSGS